MTQDSQPPDEDQSEVTAAINGVYRSVKALWFSVRKEGVGSVKKELAKKADRALNMADRVFDALAGDDEPEKKG